MLLIACTSKHPSTLAIRDVTVVDVLEGATHANRTVLVAGNRILEVGPADQVTIPSDAVVIEATGSYLIPGLWDMHVHSVTNVDWDTNITSVAAADWHLPSYLAWGVTGVRNMNDGTGDVSLAMTNSIKRRLAAGDIHGPRFLANGPTLDGDPSLASNAVVVRTAAGARAVVDTLADSGADFIKVYENLSREVYFAIMDQAQRRGMPVDGHVPFRVTPAEAAEAGQRTFEHVDAMAAGCSKEADREQERLAGILTPGADAPALETLTPMTMFRHERRLYDSRDAAACAETIRAYRQHDVAEAPNLVAYGNVVRAREILSDPVRSRLVPEVIRRNWLEMLDTGMYRELKVLLQPMASLYAQNARLLNEAGVTLLAATDVGVPAVIPGISLHEELELLAEEAGLTPMEALQSATINPARVLGLSDSLGSVEAGKLADLVLLDADPLADIRNTQRILAVVADGRLYRQSDIDRLLAEARALGREDGKQQ